VAGLFSAYTGYKTKFDQSVSKRTSNDANLQWYNRAESFGNNHENRDWRCLSRRLRI